MEQVYSTCNDIPLLTQISRLRFVRAHCLLGSAQIHPGQFHLLALLAHTDALSQKEIAAHLYIKASTLTVMIGRLMKASLVTRHKDPDDARVYRVNITEEGRRQVEKAMVGFAQIEEESFLGFTEDEKITFDRLASKMRDNLVHATQEEDPPCRWY